MSEQGPLPGSEALLMVADTIIGSGCLVEVLVDFHDEGQWSWNQAWEFDGLQTQDPDPSDTTAVPGLRFGKRAILFQLQINKDHQVVVDLHLWLKQVDLVKLSLS